jgi:hypothetical protein
MRRKYDGKRWTGKYLVGAVAYLKILSWYSLDEPEKTHDNIDKWSLLITHYAMKANGGVDV